MRTLLIVLLVLAVAISLCVAARVLMDLRDRQTTPAFGGREPRQYRKKPVTIYAMQYAPHVSQTVIAEWVGAPCRLIANDLYIQTLEGEMHVSPGDWVIQGVEGEFYPCKPDIFAKTYDPV